MSEQTILSNYDGLFAYMNDNHSRMGSDPEFTTFISGTYHDIESQCDIEALEADLVALSGGGGGTGSGGRGRVGAGGGIGSGGHACDAGGGESRPPTLSDRSHKKTAGK